jgi:serpin B
MSNGLREETYLSLNGSRGVMLPYDDGNLAYVAILPPEGTTVEEYISSLDEEMIAGLMNSAKQTKVQLSLPKYTATFDAGLNEVLSDMGLSKAFNSEDADFSKMGNADGNIYIGRVLHKTCIKVNELGTEAAAATGIEMRATSMPSDDYETLTFDRPFVYAIVDLNTGIPLFLGAMDNPAA